MREVQSVKIRKPPRSLLAKGSSIGKICLAFKVVRRLNSRMENPDQLRELFRMQKALNERIGVKTGGMNEEEKTKWILNYCRAMSQEMAELTDSVPWKWWAKYQKFDEQNARVEVVDLFHFLISMAQVLGMSADDVFAAYVKKNEVNFKRQDSGYVKKDENDSKHI
jgi:dimeric dUTPase (all-alpha-NTP-PPase superfamily)